MLKNFLDEAFVRGKQVKEEVLSQLLQSKMLEEVARSDFFSKAVTRVIKTKEDVAKALKKNVEAVFQIMDIPSRNDFSHLEQKIEHLEKVIDRVGKKAITVKSLKKIQTSKQASKK